jgi:hypothetical protein
VNRRAALHSAYQLEQTIDLLGLEIRFLFMHFKLKILVFLLLDSAYEVLTIVRLPKGLMCLDKALLSDVEGHERFKPLKAESNRVNQSKIMRPEISDFYPN